jgi:hypothetical protein
LWTLNITVSSFQSLIIFKNSVIYMKKSKSVRTFGKIVSFWNFCQAPFAPTSGRLRNCQDVCCQESWLRTFEKVVYDSMTLEQLSGLWRKRDEWRLIAHFSILGGMDYRGRAFRTQIGQSTFFVLTILCLGGYEKHGRA